MRVRRARQQSPFVCYTSSFVVDRAGKPFARLKI
jgi:hypothetical protein